MGMVQCPRSSGGGGVSEAPVPAACVWHLMTNS